MKRLISNPALTSDTVATAAVVEGFTVNQCDHLGGNDAYTYDNMGKPKPRRR